MRNCVVLALTVGLLTFVTGCGGGGDSTWLPPIFEEGEDVQRVELVARIQYSVEEIHGNWARVTLSRTQRGLDFIDASGPIWLHVPSSTIWYQPADDEGDDPYEGESEASADGSYY